MSQYLYLIQTIGFNIVSIDISIYLYIDISHSKYLKICFENGESFHWKLIDIIHEI